MDRKKWTHPTHQRVQDEAHARMGNRSKVVHVRLSEPEYDALTAAAREAGLRKLSTFVRAVLLNASQDYLDLSRAIQTVPFASQPGTTQAQANAKALEAWVDEQQHASVGQGVLTEEDLFGLAPPPPVPRLVPQPAAAEYEAPLVTLLPGPESDRILEAASASLARPDEVDDPEYLRALSHSPATGQSRLPDGKLNLAVLRQLRTIMGDDSHVDASVRAALDAEDGIG